MLCSALLGFAVVLLCFAAVITSKQISKEGLGINNISKLPAVPAALVYRASSVSRVHSLETLEMHSVSKFSSKKLNTYTFQKQLKQY